MPFSRDAALARRSPAANLRTLPGAYSGCMHPDVTVAHFDGEVIERCTSCGARVTYFVEQ